MGSKEVPMQTILKITFMLMSPYLLIVYWRNSMKEIENMHAHLEH